MEKLVCPLVYKNEEIEGHKMKMTHPKEVVNDRPE